MGFEPMDRLPTIGSFQDSCLKPLGQTSICTYLSTA